MNTTYKVLIGVVIGLLVATGVGFLIARNTITTSSLGGVVGVGQVQTNTFWFVNGLFAGTSQQWSVSSAGAMTAASMTDSGALTVKGLAAVNQAASSTLQIGAPSGTGCLEMGTASSGEVYVTVTSSTIAATTTKPAICQ